MFGLNGLKKLNDYNVNNCKYKVIFKYSNTYLPAIYNNMPAYYNFLF